MIKILESAPLILLAFAGFRGCVVLPVGEHRIPVRTERPALAAARYDLINWNLENDHRSGELLVAIVRGGFTELTPNDGRISGCHIDIVLEPDWARGELAGHFEKHPGRVVLYSLDDALLGASLFIFPWIRRVDREISFHVWNGAQLLHSYTYRSDYYLVGGFSSLLIIPFSHRGYVNYDLARIGRLFLADIDRDGILRSVRPAVDPVKYGGQK